MFLRLCGPPSIPLSFTVAGVPEHYCPTASIHRLRRGLPGYLILFDNHAFVLQRQWHPCMLPSRSEFFVISKHFTATPRIPHALDALKTDSFNGTVIVEQRRFTADLTAGLRTL